MKKYKVIRIVSGASEPPGSEDIEKAIESTVSDGWEFVQITTGGGGTGNGSVTSWVYLLFEK